MALFALDIDTRKANIGFVNSALAAGIASKNTLNTIAALTRRNYIKNAESDLTLRNTFVKRNIRFERTNFVKIKRQVTRAGATEKANLMEKQELGGIKKSKSGKNLAIPQVSARGGSNRRLVLKSNYLRKIQRKTVRWPRGKGGTKQSRIIAVAAMAKKKDLFMNYSKNIYKITSFNKMNGRVKFSKKHLYNVSQKSTKIDANPMLFPATKKPIRDAQSIYNSQIKKALRSKKII